jgi:ABC-type iron transport system FetAB ATPase subunit
VVFVVIPDIVAEPVERSVIAVCFLLKSVPEVVFCDEVSCARVQASSEEAAHEEIYEWFEPEVADQAIIKGKLYDKIKKVPFG